ncbi:molybdopterin-dependent oxidoreductase [Consotaella salsifontis]|uniref:Trimethylamine-N-oxide reductase (Cytochrome c) n=1 Tax=Consotaella salsifontis TaxID=1365950 RepID=A0A1T4T3W2_9HYPH|nr:molybdopterin-dependent oxidoreductase [Consotaella salsifontis]SKA35106.1 trimethylamine-N-oxide reductase (cytochrome c) [Consotaella salsifontis]
MINRRDFISRIVPAAAGIAMFPALARAASGAGGVTDGRVLVNTSIGPMWLTKKGGNVVGVEPLAQDGVDNPLIQSMPDRLYNRSRIVAPMVRRDFLAKREKSDRTLRGSNDFVEVSWDDAMKLVTDEISRVKTAYGNESIHRGKSSWASNHAHVHRTEAMLQRFLNGAGGCSNFFGSYSSQAITEILTAVAWGGPGTTSDWPSLHENTKLMVIWGANPVTTTRILSARYSTKAWLALKEKSIETIVIDPVRSETAQALDSRWVPITPGTDVALALGMMHTLLTEDLHDKEFLQNCTNGFDEFAEYLKGTKDGTPKTAEWAAKITGVPAETIQELARKMQATRTTIACGWSTQRQHHGEQAPWSILTLACMLGQIGLPGGGAAFGLHYADGGFPKADMPVVGGMAPGKNPVELDPFPIACLSDAWLNPGKKIQCKGREITFPDIRLVYTAGGNQFTHHQNTNRLIKAFQAPETIIVQDPWWTPTAHFADIVLPASSDLERDDIGQVINLIIASHAAVAPQHKSRPDYEIYTELASRMGFEQAYTEGRSQLDWVRKFYDDAKASSKTVQMPEFDEFWSGEGIIEFPMGKGDFTHLADFREEPLLNPMGTATGLIEIVSPFVSKLGYDDDCPGHPTWMEPVEWKGSASSKDYPLQFLSAHPPHRLHSQMDNTDAGKTYKVAGREPVYIHPEDAKARGIADGDVVKLFNGRGETLAGAVVTDNISQGVVLLHEGSWYDPQEPGKIGSLDKQGSANVLTLDDPLTSRFAQATIASLAIIQAEKYAETAPEVTAYTPPKAS